MSDHIKAAVEAVFFVVCGRVFGSLYRNNNVCVLAVCMCDRGIYVLHQRCSVFFAYDEAAKALACHNDVHVLHL